jgi:LruC domain-containing protein
MKEKFTKALWIGSLALLISCESRQDENLVWLFAVLQPNSGENTGVGYDLEEPYTEDFSMIIEDVQGSDGFIFENTTTFPVRIQVLDPIAPIQGSTVQIVEQGGSAQTQLLFRATTDDTGNVTGSFTINNREEPVVQLQVLYQGKTYQFEIRMVGIRELSRRIIIDNAFLTQIQDPDRDGDGIPDRLDDYPDDPVRASKIRIPTESFYTIAFEDLYPKQGDADFNDYVIRAFHEEDLNAQGQVVRIRGSYTHVAKGAGYNHRLRIKFPSAIIGEYQLKRYKPDNTLYLDTSSSLGSANSVELLPISNTTIPHSNAERGQVFKPGDRAEFELTLSSPVSKSDLIKAPYDLYVYVENTKQEIHFLGLYTREDGSDPYLDPAGFPWAFLVPGEFRWPLEKRNIHNAYPQFQPWYESGGQSFQSWHKVGVDSEIFSF